MRPWEQPLTSLQVQALLDIFRWLLTIAAWASSFQVLLDSYPAYAPALALAWMTGGFIVFMYAVGFLTFPLYLLAGRIAPPKSGTP